MNKKYSIKGLLNGGLTRSFILAYERVNNVDLCEVSKEYESVPEPQEVLDKIKIKEKCLQFIGMIILVGLASIPPHVTSVSLLRGAVMLIAAAVVIGSACLLIWMQAKKHKLATEIHERCEPVLEAFLNALEHINPYKRSLDEASPERVKSDLMLLGTDVINSESYFDHYRRLPTRHVNKILDHGKEFSRLNLTLELMLAAAVKFECPFTREQVIAAVQAEKNKVGGGTSGAGSSD